MNDFVPRGSQTESQELAPGTSKPRLYHQTLLVGVLLMAGCSAPTPEADLQAAVAALDIVSALPNLTPADRVWISAAANGLSCSSTVLAQGEPAAQEALAIAKCFSSLPVIPAGDQPYIQAGMAAVQLFVDLFSPTASPAAVSANAKIRKMSVVDRTNYIAVAGVQEKTQKIRSRVEKR